MPMRNEADYINQSEFMPSYEPARLAVERARQIVKQNNETINRLKQESNISTEQSAPFLEAENFSCEDSYAFDLYKIKSNNGLTDFIKDIFGVH